MTASTYTQDGVNLSAGDAFSAFAGEMCRSTYRNNPFVGVNDHSSGNFRGPRTLDLGNMPKGCELMLAPDGNGTKVVLTAAAEMHCFSAWDLLAMTCGDIDRWGGLPVALTNILEVKTLGEVGSESYQLYQELMSGLGQAANELGIVVLNGETAEMGPCISSDDPDAVTQFIWSAAAIGICNPKRIINGKTLGGGQIAVALGEDGFRANGGSSVRKALKMRFGDDVWTNTSTEARDAIRAAAVPSKTYSRFFAYLNGWMSDNLEASVRIHYIAHITGGGIQSKFAEPLFAQGLSADLHNLPDPPEIMRQCGEWRGVTDYDFYETWHGGAGVIFVIDEDDYNFCARAADDLGIRIQKCGDIVQRSHPFVQIKSKFKGTTLTYHPK